MIGKNNNWKREAVDQFESLQVNVQSRIQHKIEDAIAYPDHYLERLVGYPYFKLRVGHYRVIIDWHKETDELFVVKVGHRKKVYN